MRQFAAILVALAAIAVAPMYPPLRDGFFLFDPAWLDSTNYGVVGARTLRLTHPNDTSRIPTQIWLFSRDTSLIHPVGAKVAVLDLPPLARDEQVFFGGLCKIDRQPDPSVVAIGTTDGDSAVRKAWKADTAGKKFTPLATNGLTCNNPTTKTARVAG